MTDFLGFTLKGNLVRDFDLLEHLSVTGLLLLSYSQILSLLLLDCTDHLGLFALKLLTLLNTLNLSFLDLLNNNGSTTALSLGPKSFTLIFSLQGLQTFDFHHNIKAFLLC